MLEPITVAGPINTFNVLWKIKTLNNGGYIRAMDKLEVSSPDNRYIFGCAENNGNSYSAGIFRLLSVSGAVPNPRSFP
jgi:hypothetical protein